MSSDDPRRRIPRTDDLLGSTVLAEAVERLGRAPVKRLVIEAQAKARAGEIHPDAVLTFVVDGLPATATSLRPVVNATGVVVHTNLGRAPFSAAARGAMLAAAGYVDVELDLATGKRARRGAAVLDALTAATGAEAALVVNNGAAAVVLAATALAAGRQIVVSRGELVEIGDGFRLPDLATSTGASLCEVGTTNRTSVADYARAISDRTGFVLKVHPSNFRVHGFTSTVAIAELTRLGRPVVVDVGSGLLYADPALPDEPDVTTALADGAALVTASGDKLLGGPQAGLILGKAEFVERLRRHPLARAVRVDKLTLAALEASITGPTTPVTRMRRLTPADLIDRTTALAQAVGGQVVASAGQVGGGGAPGVDLPGLAVALPERVAVALRHGDPPVLARVDQGRCLVDLRCVPPSSDRALTRAVLRALGTTPTPSAALP